MTDLEDLLSQLEPRYGCDLTRVPPRLASRFLPSSLDEAARRFVERARAERPGRLKSVAQGVLRSMLGDFEANALLGMYPMHLLATEQWQRLLGDAARGRLLDVGAGSGDVTAALAPLFSEVVTTELARAARRKLERRGLRCFDLDVAASGAPSPPYDVVACLNVLDRTARPQTLLDRACAGLRPAGHLLLALALPYDPFVYRGGSSVPPDERLACTSARFEQAVSELVTRELEPRGLFVRRWTRAPYLSGGDARRELYVLDDVILACQRELLDPRELPDGPG